VVNSGSNNAPENHPDHHHDLGSVLGPARLAYFTPVFEQPTLADRKAMFILGASGLLVTVLMFFAPPLQALRPGCPDRPAGIRLDRTACNLP